jgi:hypothetical protein
MPHRFDTWRDQIQIARSAEDVSQVVNEYVAALKPVLTSLPEDCQRALTPPINVQEAAVSILMCELRFSGSDEVRAILHEIAHTFAAASMRLTSLYGGLRRNAAP